MIIITTSQGGHLVNRFLLDQVQETGTLTAVNSAHGDMIREALIFHTLHIVHDTKSIYNILYYVNTTNIEHL